MFNEMVTRSVGGRKLISFLLLLIALEFFPAVRAEAQSASDLKLIGTIRSASFSGAVFSDSAGLQTFFRINALLPDGSRLTQVSSKSILLKTTDGIQYELFISQDLKTAGQTSPPPTSMEPVTQGEDPPRERRKPRKQANREQRQE